MLVLFTFVSSDINSIYSSNFFYYISEIYYFFPKGKKNLSQLSLCLNIKYQVHTITLQMSWTVFIYSPHHFLDWTSLYFLNLALMIEGVGEKVSQFLIAEFNGMQSTLNRAQDGSTYPG